MVYGYSNLLTNIKKPEDLKNTSKFLRKHENGLDRTLLTFADKGKEIVKND